MFKLISNLIWLIVFIPKMIHTPNKYPLIGFGDAKTWWHMFLVHRGNDLPALIQYNGTQIWYQHGKVHRGNGQPAVVGLTFHKEWWVNGKLHRENDLPAIMTFSMHQWFLYGEKHRSGDLPAVICSDGTLEWWRNNKRHRLNTPSVITPKLREWYYYGERHRQGGPAVIRRNEDNSYSAEWWFYNHCTIVLSHYHPNEEDLFDDYDFPFNRKKYLEKKSINWIRNGF